MYLIAGDLFRPMVTTPTGWGLIGMSLVLIALGWVWIRKIVSIDV